MERKFRYGSLSIIISCANVEADVAARENLKVVGYNVRNLCDVRAIGFVLCVSAARHFVSGSNSGEAANSFWVSAHCAHLGSSDSRKVLMIKVRLGLQEPSRIVDVEILRNPMNTPSLL